MAARKTASAVTRAVAESLPLRWQILRCCKCDATKVIRPRAHPVPKGWAVYLTQANGVAFCPAHVPFQIVDRVRLELTLPVPPKGLPN